MSAVASNGADLAGRKMIHWTVKKTREARMRDDARDPGEGKGRTKSKPKYYLSWRRMLGCVWEGTQMALMGGFAAAVAVVVIKAFQGLAEESG
jgi:hypothetical protein